MALGDIYQLDNPKVTFGGTDISSAVQKARLMVDHVEIDVDAAFGEDVRRTVASAAYSWSVEFEFRTDGYATGTLDAVITSKMHPPLGSGDGDAVITIEPTLIDSKTTISPANPRYSGTVAVSGWEPLGPGNSGAVVVQTRTFKGNSQLVKATS